MKSAVAAMTRVAIVFGATAALGAAPAAAMQTRDPVEIVRRHVERRSAEMVTELRNLVSIPNVASDRKNIRRNADFLIAMLKKRGATTRLIETAGPPIVYAEIGDPKLPAVLFYFHYDGQPAGDAGWMQPSPWIPVLRSASIAKGGRVMQQWPTAGSRVDPEWRIYARSASDDKAPIVAFMAVLDAWRAAGIPFRNRIKMIFEGDEEAGSAYLAQVVRDNQDLLAADLVVMADGPIHPSNRPTADFGLRGIVPVTLTVYGPISPLHSGHYGNWAVNPAMALAHLLTSMKSPSGEVLVAGWDDDAVPPGAEERAAWARYPHDDSSRRLQLQLGAVEGRGASRMELIARPSLNVRGMSSLFTGAEARTLIPDVAVAELDLRLVSGNDPQRQVAKLVRHIERQGWTVVRDAPDSSTRVRSPKLVRVQAGDGYPAGRTPLSSAAAKALIAALATAGLGEPVVSPTMGGSGPSYVFTDILRAPFVALPTVNHDNNQHAANENIRLGNLFRGAQILAAAASANLRNTAVVNESVADAKTIKLRTPGQSDSLRAILRKERALWRANSPPNYQFQLRVGCFCPGQKGWLLIEVRSNQPLRASDSAGKPVALTDWNTLSIEGLFDNLERTAGINGVVQVSFDPRWHFPTYISTVRLPGPDTWALIEAREFRPL